MCDKLSVATALMDIESSEQVKSAALTMTWDFVEFRTEADWLSNLGADLPDILFMDLSTSPDTVLAIQQRLRKLNEPIAIVYYCSEMPKVEHVVRAMEYGAVTVSTPENHANLLDLLSNAATVFTSRRKWIERIREARARLKLLSERQTQVLHRIVRGNTNKAVAIQLHISSKTVEKHRHMIHRRTSTRSLPQLIELAVLSTLPLEAAFGSCPEISIPELEFAEDDLALTP